MYIYMSTPHMTHHTPPHTHTRVRCAVLRDVCDKDLG